MAAARAQARAAPSRSRRSGRCSTASRGVYDRHELGHDGRAAPPLARARGRPRRASARATAALDVATRHRRPRDRARRPRRARRARSSARDFSEEMLDRARARRKAAAAIALRVGQRARAALRRRRASTPRPSASARATSPTSTRGLAEMARVVRPGRPRRRARDHDAAAAAAVDVLPRCGSTASCPALGAVAGDARRLHLPAELRASASPAPTELAARWPRAGLRDIRWILTAGGIIAIHVGRAERVTGTAHGRSTRDRRTPAAPHVGAAAGARRGAAAREIARAAHGAGAGRARRRRTIAAGGKRLRPLLVLLAAGGPPTRRRGRSCARPWRSSSSTAATLVHDDVLDAARAAPRAPDGRGRRPAAMSPTATGDLLFSRAFAELRRNGAPTQVRALVATRARRWPRASCCSARTPATRDVSRRALPASAAS